MTSTAPSRGSARRPATGTTAGPDPAGGTVEPSRSDRGGSRSVRDVITAGVQRQEATLLAVILVIGVAAAIRNPAFLHLDNLVEILRSSVIYFVMGCGAALLIIGGGLDFSVGAVFTFSGLVACILMRDGWPVILAIVGGVVAGGLVGVVNHLLISYWHVPPIIATLGTYFVLIGLNLQISGGDDILPLPNSFLALGQGFLAGVSAVIWYAVVIGVVCWFALEHTRFGVNVRALGGNRQASVGNGLRVRRLDLALYVIAGVTAALAGIIYAARVGAGQVAAGGAQTTLVVITAVLIGGVSLFGGLGTITGVAIGAVLLSEIDNALIVSRIPPQYNTIIVGAILVSAVAVDHLRRQRLYKRR